MWDGGPIPGELGKFPGYLLARLGEASRRRFHRALEPEGLHPRHFGVMTMVAARPGISQQELHEKTAIDPSSIARELMNGSGSSPASSDSTPVPSRSASST